MTTDQAQAAIRTAFVETAPDVDVDALPADERFRSAADLDSLDFLSLIEHLRDITGVDIPEMDYPRVETLSDLASYLVAHGK